VSLQLREAIVNVVEVLVMGVGWEMLFESSSCKMCEDRSRQRMSTFMYWQLHT
jgi:hypothetical protein